MKMLDNTFTTGKLRLHCAVGPESGPPRYCFTAYAGTVANWLPILSSVQPRWKVWRPMRGHGDSDRAARAYKVNDYVGDALVILAQLDQPALIGATRSAAMVAAAVAAEAPDAVRGLFLEKSAVSHDGEGDFRDAVSRLFTGM